MKTILQLQLNNQFLKLLANFSRRSRINACKYEVRLRKLLGNGCRRTNKIIVTFQRPQLSNTSDQQTIRRQPDPSQELLAIKITFETIDINTIRYHCDLFITKYPLRSQFARNCLRHCNHLRRAPEGVPVQSIELKQHVTCRDKLRFTIATCCVRSERVVA